MLLVEDLNVEGSEVWFQGGDTCWPREEVWKGKMLLYVQRVETKASTCMMLNNTLLLSIYNAYNLLQCLGD